MEHTYTDQEFIQFIYEDMDAIEYMEMLFAIDESPRDSKKVKDIKKEIQELPKISLSPSKKSIDLILCYNSL